MRQGGAGALIVGYRRSCPSANRQNVPNFAADPVSVRRLFRGLHPPRPHCDDPAGVLLGRALLKKVWAATTICSLSIYMINLHADRVERAGDVPN
jgi:hypothetical protein